MSGTSSFWGGMPSGLVDDEHAMSTGRDGLADFGQVQTHRVSVAAGQDRARAGSLRRTVPWGGGRVQNGFCSFAPLIIRAKNYPT